MKSKILLIIILILVVLVSGCIEEDNKERDCWNETVESKQTYAIIRCLDKDTGILLERINPLVNPKQQYYEIAFNCSGTVDYSFYEVGGGAIVERCER